MANEQKSIIRTLEMHTGGEPLRIILSGKFSQKLCGSLRLTRGSLLNISAQAHLGCGV